VGENMEFISESPEHHFLVIAEKVKASKGADKGDWLAARINFASDIDHKKVLMKPLMIKPVLEELQEKSEALFSNFKQDMEAQDDLIVYHFLDGDIVLLRETKTDDEKRAFTNLYNDMQAAAGKDICEFFDMTKSDYAFHKLVDDKFIETEKIRAYLSLADVNKLRSIPLRRDRREDPVVLMVEDDAFTAEYAENILSKEYTTVIARSGEEALIAYIEHAPDIVFMDIHLPGLNGHQTLNTMLRIDPRAHVVMLSVDAVKDNIVNANKIGAAGFLKKPFSSDRLVHAVRKSPYVTTVVAPADPVPDDVVSTSVH
jgi:two-component system chemotaxis response regulator CheY